MDEVLKTNDWVTCPYDPNHTMKYSKFHNHFVKCKAAHPEDIREQCPYYASELIYPDKMKEHLLTCKYRTLYANLFFDSSDLPKYDAPCHFNLDNESGNESDDDAKTVITVDRDDSSLFSATTHSYKASSTISKPIGKIYRNNFIDPKPPVESYAFAYIDDDDPNTSLVEILGQEDSGRYSWESANRDSFLSNRSSLRDNESSSSLGVDPPARPFEPKMGLGRGKVIQMLLNSSTTSLDSFGVKKGSGRGDWFRRKTADSSINNHF